MFLENNASRTRHAVNEDCYEIEFSVSVYVSYQHDENRIRVSAYGRATGQLRTARCGGGRAARV